MDLSFGGMQIEYPPTQDPGFPRGTLLTVTLQRGGAPVRVRGEVVRRTDSSYGLMFSEHFHLGKLDAPEDYRTLVLEIERIWLKARSD